MRFRIAYLLSGVLLLVACSTSGSGGSGSPAKCTNASQACPNGEVMQDCITSNPNGSCQSAYYSVGSQTFDCASCADCSQAILNAMQACGTQPGKDGGAGGSGGTGADGGTPDAAGGAGGGGGNGDPTALATAICNKLEQCDAMIVTITWGDVATCIQRETLGYLKDIAAPGASVTPAQMSACADAYSKATCDVVYTGGPPSCMFPGSRADGQPCGAPTQCKSDYCSITSGACGTCKEPQPAGGPCTTDPSDCQRDLYCVSGVCTKPVTSGGQCSSSIDCGYGLACESGVCAKAKQAGQQCDPQTDDCDQNAGLFCDSNSSCSKIPLSSAGSPCGLVGGQLVLCAAGSCEGQPQGTCMGYAGDGAQCDMTNGPQCEDPSTCVNGTCQLPDPASCG